MGFSRQEYWSGLPCPSPGDLPDKSEPLIKPDFMVELQAGGAAAAAKSLQLCLTLCDPRDGSPPDSPIPGILQARTLEWVAVSFSKAWKWKVRAKSFSPVQLFATPWTAAYQALPSMGFSRQEYWSGVPLPSPKQSINVNYIQLNDDAFEFNYVLTIFCLMDLSIHFWLKCIDHFIWFDFLSFPSTSIYTSLFIPSGCSRI